MSFITGGVLFPSNAGNCHSPHRTSAKSRRRLVSRKTRRIWRLVEVVVDSSTVSLTMYITCCSEFSVLGMIMAYSFTTKSMHTCRWTPSSKNTPTYNSGGKSLFISCGPDTPARIFHSFLQSLQANFMTVPSIMTAFVRILSNSSSTIIHPLDIKWPIQLQRDC